MSPSQPGRTRTKHPLPFERLSPRDFERLCLWLVEREGYQRAEHLGASGGELGRDVQAWREGRRWAFQCKRVRRFGPADALTEVDKLLSLPADQRPAELVFLVTCDVSANARQQARERWGDEHTCHFWAGTELDHRVKQHDEIVDEFFGPAALTLLGRAVAPAPPAHFQGREAELADLARALTHSDTPQAITALQGMGGIGKTALAQQLAATLDGQLPGGIFWADLPANEGDPMPLLAAWARLCGADVSALPEAAARAGAVRGLLAEHQRDPRPGPGRAGRRAPRLAGRGADPGRRPAPRPAPAADHPPGAHRPGPARPHHPPGHAGPRRGPRVAGRADRRCADRRRRRPRGRVVRLPAPGPGAGRRRRQRRGPGLAAGPLASRAARRLDALALDDACRKEESVRLTFDLSYGALAEAHPETARAFRVLGAFAPAPVSVERLAGVLAWMDKGDERARARPGMLELELANCPAGPRWTPSWWMRGGRKTAPPGALGLGAARGGALQPAPPAARLCRGTA